MYEMGGSGIMNKILNMNLFYTLMFDENHQNMCLLKKPGMGVGKTLILNGCLT